VDIALAGASVFGVYLPIWPHRFIDLSYPHAITAIAQPHYKESFMVTLENPAMNLMASLNSNLLTRMRQTAAPLFWVGLTLLALSVPTLALTLLDSRQLQGVSVWLKPFKFQISTGVYLLTLALFMVWLPAQALLTKKARYVVWGAVISGLFEVGYITVQGSLGLASHYNLSSRFFANMYTLMGIGAVVLASAAMVLGILIARTQAYELPAALKLAVVLGLILTFVIGTGFGGYLSAQRAGHWVGGVLSDSGGLPLVKWSRSGGDLRVAHFFGIHAMHFIPAFAFALQIAGLKQMTQTRAVGVVWIFAVAFTGFCTWTFVQALRGLPFLA
jgi:hypothetical protein